MPTSKQFPGGTGPRSMPVLSVRKVEVRAEGSTEPVTRYEIACSSETPVERFDFWTGQTYREVLGHEPSEVQMTRFKSGRANLLEEHRGAPVGVLDEASLDPDKVLRAMVRFSRTQRGKDAETDLADPAGPVRGSTSVGYIPKKARLIEENAELGDLWRVTLWEPVEVSLVGVPADPTVGAGREAGGGKWPPVEIEDGESVREVRTMTQDPKQPAAAAEQPATRSAVTVADQPAPKKSESAEIFAMCRANDIPDKTVKDWLERELNGDQVAREIVKLRATMGTPQPGSESLEETVGNDWTRYSLRRALLNAANVREGIGKFDGIEGEVHRYYEKNWPAGLTRKGGIFVPMRFRKPDPEREEGVQRRTLDSKTQAKGTETVFEQQGEMIELLRNRTVLMQAGARVLTGLTGPVAFPKQTGATSAVWVGENPGSGVSATDVGFGLVLMNPKSLMGKSGYTRQLLSQSSIDVDGMIKSDLALVHAIAFDRAGFHGAGTNGEPMGIYKYPGVSSVAFGGTAANYPKLVDMQSAVAQLNADLGSLRYVTNPYVAGKLKQNLKFNVNGASEIWDGDFREGNIGGYPASATNQLSAVMTGSEATGGAESGILFGNWQDVVIGMFNVLELIVDPYAKKDFGIIEITSFQMADLIVRHGESFSKSTGAT